MKAIVSLGVSALAVVAGTLVYSSNRTSDSSSREIRIKGGRTAMYFLPGTLKQKQLTVDFSATHDKKEDCSVCANPGMPIQDSNLRFKMEKGKVVQFDGGKIAHKGTFKLKGAKKSIEADEITLSPTETSEGGLNLTIDSPKGSIVAFELRKPVGLHEGKDEELVLQDMEVVVSEELAKELDNPELAGTSIGSMTLYAEAVPEDGGGAIEAPAPAPAVGLDISLSALSNLAVASNPTGRVGTFPNGRTGLTMSTTSCNVGTVNIPWNAPMQTTHPVIALNLYRLMNGRFEQVGWSWLKHGFLSTNSNNCGTCQNPGTGALLGLNCSDTYGTGNNGDRTYLGARDEVNPFTGVWTCQASWFSNYINDCVRRNPGQVTLDAVDHRLDCLDSDLGNAGARYFYEAFYITPNDINTYNNLGSREASMSWTGTTWSINWQVDNMIQGPAINRWGEQRSTATPQAEGDVIVAVQTSNNGNGTWHYEFAVYNHNLDRQVREFSVPMPFGAAVTNIGFHDVDRDANNQWTATQNDHSLVWSSPTFGQAGANPLKYSSIFNFRFDANVQPATTLASMGLYKPGANGTLTAASKGPLFLEPPTSYSIVNGFPRGGNIGSLEDSDGDKLVLGPEDSSSRSGTGVITTATAPAGAITQITFGVESSNNLTTGGGCTQTIELYNWGTTQYEVIDTRPATLTDTMTTLNITTNPSRFVNSTTREVRARILHKTDVGSGGNRWTMALDQVGLHFN